MRVYQCVCACVCVLLLRVFAHAGTRVIRPGQMVTKDFRPLRLNVYLDKDNKITDVKFG